MDKEGGQVAHSMPHGGLCGIVRLQQLLLQDEAETKASATSKNENQDQNRRPSTKNNSLGFYRRVPDKRHNVEML